MEDTLTASNVGVAMIALMLVYQKILLGLKCILWYLLSLVLLSMAELHGDLLIYLLLILLNKERKSFLKDADL